MNTEILTVESLINESKWEELFKPVKNTIDDNASYNGAMFETFGKELDFVLAQNEKAPGTVWTLVEGDEGEMVIASGYHLVNRIGYFITEKALFDGLLVEVLDDDDWEQRLADSGE